MFGSAPCSGRLPTSSGLEFLLVYRNFLLLFRPISSVVVEHGVQRSRSFAKQCYALYSETIRPVSAVDLVSGNPYSRYLREAIIKAFRRRDPSMIVPVLLMSGRTLTPMVKRSTEDAREKIALIHHTTEDVVLDSASISPSPTFGRRSS